MSKTRDGLAGRAAADSCSFGVGAIFEAGSFAEGYASCTAAPAAGDNGRLDQEPEPTLPV